jgi:hypothetical protein
VKPAPRSKILLIDNETTPVFAYLIARYAKQGGQILPSLIETRALHPAAILFQSVESLEISQDLINNLGDCDAPVLGADLLHPLTYDSDLAALAAT